MRVTVKKSAKQLQIQVSALNSVSWLIVLGCFGCQVVTLKSKEAKNEIRIPLNLIAFTCSSPKDTGTSVTDGGLQHVIILARHRRCSFWRSSSMDFLLMLVHQNFCWTTRFFLDIKTQKTSKPKKRTKNDEKKFDVFSFFRLSDLTWSFGQVMDTKSDLGGENRRSIRYEKSVEIFVYLRHIYIYIRLFSYYFWKKSKYILMICALFANTSETIDTHLRDLLITSCNSLSGCVCKNWPMPFSIADTTQDFFVLICMNLDFQNGCCWDAIFQRKYAWHETLCDLQQFLLLC